MLYWAGVQLASLKYKKSKLSRTNVYDLFYLLTHTRESVTPLYKLLDVLKLDNVFNLKISVLVHKIKYAKTNIPNTFSDLTLPVQDIHKYNTGYALKDNLYRPASRTNYGLSKFKAVASRTWEKIPPAT